MKCVFCGGNEGKKPENMPEGYPICDDCATNILLALRDKLLDG